MKNVKKKIKTRKYFYYSGDLSTFITVEILVHLLQWRS